MKRVLITGANRGLGLQFTRGYLERGDQVFAGCRRPETARQLQELQAAHSTSLTIVGMDVGNIESIRKSHAAVRSHVDGLELLINNAGIYSVHGSEEPIARLGELDFEDALRVLQVNAVGPLIVAQQYLDLLRAGNRAKIVSIESLNRTSRTEARSSPEWGSRWPGRDSRSSPSRPSSTWRSSLQGSGRFATSPAPSNRAAG